MLKWMQDQELRQHVQIGLNKGETRNALARAVFFNRQGEMRDRNFENQNYRSSGLNLVVAPIILWNTAYLEHAIAALKKQGKPIREDLIPHISPQAWEHINLTGDYIWKLSRRVAAGQFRPENRVVKMGPCKKSYNFLLFGAVSPFNAVDLQDTRLFLNRSMHILAS